MAGGDDVMQPSKDAVSNGFQGTSVADVARLVPLQLDPDENVFVEKAPESENQRIVELQRVNAALELELRTLAKKNAKLQSGALDLQDEGKTMRAVLTTQNETLIQKMADLTDERKSVKENHEKILSECAGMHAELEDLRCRQKQWAGLE